MTWPLPSSGLKTIHLIQGEIKVSHDPGAVITTLVGSCVSACIFDDRSQVGGMNHFLLPEDPSGVNKSNLFGINQMEILINKVLSMGARKSNLKAKLFGGNRMTACLNDIGSKNAELAETFLRMENIPCIASSLRGNRAQRIQLHPTSGKARVKYISDQTVIKAAPPPVIVPVSAPTGEVELF